MVEKTSYKIFKKLENYEPGQPFSNKELLQFGTRASVDQTLSRLQKAGKLMRVGRGIYVRPTFNRYVGAVAPEPVTAVRAKLEAEKQPLQIQGIEAARQFQLTTQVPKMPVFYTTGSNRRFRIGNLPIRVKHVAARRLVLAGRPAGDALAALWYLGKQNVSEQVIAKIEAKLTPEEFKTLLSVKASMPAWLADTLYRYERKKEQQLG